MKTCKIISTVVALSAMILIGCSKDVTSPVTPEQPTPENPVPEPETKVLKVVVNNNVESDPAASPESRGTLTDGVGFNWENTDDQQFYVFVKGIDGTTKSNGIEIDAEGNATFTFNTAIKASRQMWFFYGAPNIDGKKNECTIAASQIQSTPGKMDKTHILLRSDLIDIEEDSQIVMPKTKFIGSIQRFLIYSATGLYSDEKVQSITMTSADNIAGLLGYNSAGQPIGIDATVKEKETLYWNQSKTISLSITTPTAVAATNRNETLHHGLYMGIAPVTVPVGYTYVINTDKATYTLTSASAKTFENGQLVNIFVNLENANVKRMDLSALQLSYRGGLGDNYNVSAEAAKSGLSYWVAYVHNGQQETQHSSFPADKAFYSSDNITFSVTDTEGRPVNWLTCAYRNNDTWWDVTYEANMGAARTAVITATYNVPGYNCTTPTKTVRVTQAPYTDEKILTYQNKSLAAQVWGNLEFNNTNTGTNWFVAYINGIPKDGVTYFGEPYYRNVEFTTQPVVDWITFYLPGNSNNIHFNSQANNTGADRMVTVTVKYAGTDDGYTITEENRIVGTFNFTQTK